MLCQRNGCLLPLLLPLMSLLLLPLLLQLLLLPSAGFTLLLLHRYCWQLLLSYSLLDLLLF